MRTFCLLVAAFLCFRCGAAELDLDDGEPGDSAGEALGDATGISLSNPTTVARKLAVTGGATYGFSDHGGGYIDFFATSPTGPNVASVGYGRGFQSAIRSKLHGGVYNPTQAGFTDHCGKTTGLSLAASRWFPAGNQRRVVVQRFAAPLFQADNQFDFVENETPCEDGYTESGPRKDTDNFVDGPDEWANEVKSNFDFSGFYEDASPLALNGAGVLRHVFIYDWARVQGALRQFGPRAVMADGSPVLELGSRWDVPDISPTQYGGSQPARDSGEDLASVFQDWGFRLHDTAGFDTVQYLDRLGALQSGPVPAEGGTLRIAFMGQGAASLPLVILSNGAGQAVGLYWPLDSRCNLAEVRGIAADGTTKYSENRTTDAYVEILHNGGTGLDPTYHYPLGQIAVKAKTVSTGLFAPDRTAALSGGAANHERMFGEVYLLTGSVPKIVEAARTLSQKVGGISCL